MHSLHLNSHNFWEKQKLKIPQHHFFYLITGQRSLQISAQTVENPPEANLKENLL